VNPKRYDGYKAYQYLEAGVDYKEYELVEQLDRVPSRKVEVSAEQEQQLRDFRREMAALLAE